VNPALPSLPATFIQNRLFMDFKPGFRISKIDLLVLAIGVLLAGYCYPYSKVVSLVICFVVGHFFLFCNVTRMSRVPELIWSSIFLCFAGFSVSTGHPSWLITFSLSTSVTFILIFLEIRKPRYHGILWQILNPNLPDWFNETRGK
jgi:hypothetical protein